VKLVPFLHDDFRGGKTYAAGAMLRTPKAGEACRWPVPVRMLLAAADGRAKHGTPFSKVRNWLTGNG